MSGNHPASISQTRRDVLKGIGAASVATLAGGSLPPAVSASERGSSADRVVLGDFESGLDGWTTDDENVLERVERSERPFAVTSGQYGLKASTGGDAPPRIANERRVEDADLVANPYLFATVTPGEAPETDSALNVRFRLHYADDGLLGDVVSVERSPATTVQPNAASTVTWDLGSVAEEKRANATRLEIVWYPDFLSFADGLLDGDLSSYEGSAVFDDVYLSDDRERAELVLAAEQWEALQFALGAYERTTVLDRSDEREVGEFVFDSGATVPYVHEVLSADRIRYVIDGVTYRLGGDWE